MSTITQGPIVDEGDNDQEISVVTSGAVAADAAIAKESLPVPHTTFKWHKSRARIPSVSKQCAEDMAAVFKESCFRSTVLELEVVNKMLSIPQVASLMFRFEHFKPYPKANQDSLCRGTRFHYQGNVDPDNGVVKPLLITRLGSFDNPLKMIKPFAGFISDQKSPQYVAASSGRALDIDKITAKGTEPNNLLYDWMMTFVIDTTAKSSREMMTFNNLMNRVCAEATRDMMAAEKFKDATADKVLEYEKEILSHLRPIIGCKKPEEYKKKAHNPPEFGDCFTGYNHPEEAGFFSIKVDASPPGLPDEDRKSKRRGAFVTSFFFGEKRENPQPGEDPIIKRPATFRDMLVQHDLRQGEQFELSVVIDVAPTRVENKTPPTTGIVLEAVNIIIVPNVARGSIAGSELKGYVNKESMLSRLSKISPEVQLAIGMGDSGAASGSAETGKGKRSNAEITPSSSDTSAPDAKRAKALEDLNLNDYVES